MEASQSFMTSVVVGKDIVPRIGLHQLEMLRHQLTQTLHQSQQAKVGQPPRTIAGCCWQFVKAKCQNVKVRTRKTSSVCEIHTVSLYVPLSYVGIQSNDELVLMYESKVITTQ